MRTRRLKFQDMVIVVPDSRPDVTHWLRTSGTQIAARCLERGGSARFVTHAAVRRIEQLAEGHIGLFTHAFGASLELDHEREPDIVGAFLDGNRSFRRELLNLDQLLAELREPLLILRDVDHSHVAAIADWLRFSAESRISAVVLILRLPPSSGELNRLGSIQMIRHSLRVIREAINITVFVTVSQEDQTDDVNSLQDATLYNMSSSDIIQAAESGELLLKTFKRDR